MSSGSGPANAGDEPELAEQANPRVSYAMHHENDGSAAKRQQLVASRAARAMRDGNRYMDGSP
jgi:hypothetical protein